MIQLLERGTRVFPNLPFIYRAEGFLHRCCNLSIAQQLAERWIEEIHAIPFEAQGLVTSNLNRFYLNLNITRPVCDQAVTIGEAIAETFLYNFTHPLPNQQINPDWREEFSDYGPDYGERWVEINTLSKIVEWLQYNIH